MKLKDIISALDLTREDYEKIFEDADRFRKNGITSKLLERKIIATAFFEPSTRTMLSFHAAAVKLGASVIGFSGTEGISVMKGENLADTIRMLNSYSDLIVIRHKYDGAALFAAEVSLVPVINAGDGKHEHPTQALIDLYTVREVFNTIDNLTFGLFGDLKYARTINSLLRALTRFKPKRVYLISPPQLKVRREVLEDINYPVYEKEYLNEIINELDVLYVTRIQRERFPDEIEYQKVKESYRVTKEILKDMKKNSIILHPLPRVNEIDREVDKDPRAKYFLQSSLGVPVRMALLYNILG